MREDTLSNDELVKLQDTWIATQSDEVFTQLYIACLSVARAAIKDRLGKTGWRLTPSQLKEKAHDATMLFLGMLKKGYQADPAHPWRCQYFKARMMFDVRVVLYRKDYREESHEELDAQLPSTLLYKAPEERADYDEMFHELMQSPYSNTIILELYRHKSYKDFILAVARFVPKSWIYNRAVALKAIFKHTRKRKQR